MARLITTARIALPTAFIIALLLGAIPLQRALVSHANRDVETFYGIQLGMTIGEARAHFGARSGRWAFTGTADKGTLEWVEAAPRPNEPIALSLEIHEGLVQVIRADLTREDPVAIGNTVEASLFSVIGRERTGGDGYVRLTVVSRGCSEQTAEVARLFALSDKRYH